MNYKMIYLQVVDKNLLDGADEYLQLMSLTSKIQNEVAVQ